MAANLYAPTFRPTPPQKGSFPLDHEHKCDRQMLEYMLCLQENKQTSLNCRELAKHYFSCRMDNELMEKEEWGRLGLPSDVKKES